jgi:hypothetical protein
MSDGDGTDGPVVEIKITPDNGLKMLIEDHEGLREGGSSPLAALRDWIAVETVRYAKSTRTLTNG